MAEAQQTIAVAGGTPFAFVLAGLLAADHGHEVHIVAPAPSLHGVPLPPSFSIAPVTRPETLNLASSGAPEIMRRLAKVAPSAIDRTDLIVRATTAHHAKALSHFRHLAAGMEHVVERLADSRDGTGMAVRIRDVTRLSATPFLANVEEWTSRIGLNLVEDPDALKVRRNGITQLGNMDVDLLVLADDDAILAHLGAARLDRIGENLACTAYIAEAGHGIDDPQLALPAGTLLNPQRDGTLAIFADNSGGLADARVAAFLTEGTTVRRAAMRSFSRFRTHDGAPVVGTPKGSRLYVAAGLGPLDIALAPVIARHISGRAHGFEAEWCGMRAPTRAMSGSVVADIAPGADA